MKRNNDTEGDVIAFAKKGGPPIERPFPTGAVVYLKSGGPPLTVNELPGTKPLVVSVDWFDTDGYAHRSEYHQDQLTLVESSMFLIPDGEGQRLLYGRPPLDTAISERVDTIVDTTMNDPVLP